MTEIFVNKKPILFSAQKEAPVIARRWDKLREQLHEYYVLPRLPSAMFNDEIDEFFRQSK